MRSFYEGTESIYDPTSLKNVTWYKSSAQLVHKYSVHNEMWHNVVFLLCSADSPNGYKVSASTTISGEVTFRNPYGFIPAELYGILPFEVNRPRPARHVICSNFNYRVREWWRTCCFLAISFTITFIIR